jgi:hypothetical protein
MKTWYEELERVRKLNIVSSAETSTPNFPGINTDQEGRLPNPDKYYDDEDMMHHTGVAISSVPRRPPRFPAVTRDRFFETDPPPSFPTGNTDELGGT